MTLRERIKAAVESGKSVAISLRELTFIDPTGLGVLIGGLRLAREAGVEFRLIAQTGPVTKVLTITGLDGVLPISNSIEEACAAHA